MRIVFAMPYPGYLRYFDSVVRLLAERGHSVELWFETPRKQPEGLEAVASLAAVTVAGALPKRRDRFAHAARASRLALDYVRYLDPRFAEAAYLRDRIGRKLPNRLAVLRRVGTLPHRLVMLLVRAGLAVERALPRAPEFDRLVAASKPDLVVAAPVLTPASRLADLIESAQAAGVPTVGAVASWDNLTTKGIFRVVPDRILVWNEVQADEAVELHALPRGRIAVTGAQPFDRWFDRAPTSAADEFKRRVGLPADHPYILFTGSTASISNPDAEIEFVREWLRRLRSGPARLREVGVMVRPHPYNSAHWPGVDLSEYGAAVVWPPSGANPVNEDDRAEYFDSIHHSSAVVGINTTAMIEAAIQRKPVLSIALPEFQETQGGTLHFRYLLPENGGFVRVAASLDEHLAQLDDLLERPDEARASIDAFVGRFLRPNGVDRPCAPIVVEVLEDVARSGAGAPRRDPLPVRVLAALALRTIFFASDPRGTLRRRLGGAIRRQAAVLRG